VEKYVNKIGWIASMLALTMYLSYVDQIFLNLDGQKGSLILPIATTLNCSAWTMYGWFKSVKDWPIIVCNIPGIILGIVTAVTVII